MALSEYEKQVLAELEQQLRHDDAELGSSFDKTTQQMEDNERGVVRPALSPRTIAISFVLVLVGLVLLVVGVSVFRSIMILGVLAALCGFALMLFGVMQLINKKFGGRKNRRDASGHKKMTFMERQERKFDERHNND